MTIESATELPPFPVSAWRGIFGDYRDLIANVSECPEPFHFANFLAVLSAELSDRFRLAEGKTTFLNFFIFCVGRTGTKKSTASDLISEHISNRLIEPAHRELTSVSSAEGLIRALFVNKNLMLRYDEIKDLFATAARSGQRLEPILNQTFDLRRVQAIVKKKTESLTAIDYFLTLLLNGTPDHVRIDLSESFFSGGLLNRFLVFAAEPTGKSLPIMGTLDGSRAFAMAKRIDALRLAWHAKVRERAEVAVGFSAEASALYAEWYNARTQWMQTAPDMEVKPLTRMDLYAKKLAAVYCLAESAPSAVPTITADQMRTALDVIAYCQASMLWMTQSWTGQRTALQQSEKLSEARIESWLAEHGCMNERHLYRSLHMSAADCMKVINVLIQSGVVNVDHERPRKVHYRELCRCFEDDRGDAE